jgi:Response regulator containing CheY-like receiver, AAA-type ATPase, and DNA-binding domains
MSHEKSIVFIVEDDAAFNKLISAYIKTKAEYEVYSFLSGEECLEKINRKPDVVLMDYDLPFRDGIEVMSVFKKKSPASIFIFLSGQTNVKVAVEALKEGAFDYIVKDNHAKENALNKIDQALRMKHLEKDQRSYKMIIRILTGIIVLSWIALFLYFLLR